MTMQRARNRFREALTEQLEAAETQSEQDRVYNEAIEKLVKIAIDEEELDRVTGELRANGLIETPESAVAVNEPKPEDIESVDERHDERTGGD